ncbi:hypothetical protein [Clostridium homopropionicum]|uniref:hypothetical protein n=1 Tax=Clostridium homopropionicum TaxID=36844 RepID=UPI0006921350|nr:hypothetical protein [Clostridium homopropionicum]
MLIIVNYIIKNVIYINCNFIGSYFDRFSFGTILIVPIILEILGLFAAYLSIKNIENEDAV